MIQFQCDKCDMEIEVDDHLAGSKHECIGCGDINRVPAVSGIELESEPDPITPKNIDRAAEAGFAPDFGPEVRVLLVRRCWFRSRVFKFSLIVLLIITGLIGLVWMLINDKSYFWIALFLPMLFGGVSVLCWWLFDRLGTSLEITTKRTIMHRGIFSKSSSEVVHDNIRNIQVEQSFFQRLFSVGKIGISSSGQDGLELEVNHLKDPNNLRKIIDLYRPL